MVVSVAAALVAEYLDPTVKDSEVLQAVQGYPVLAVIPQHFSGILGAFSI